MQWQKIAHDKWLWIAGALLAVLYFFGDTLEAGAAAVSGDDSFTQWDALFKKYGSQFNVPWRWMKAICMNESSLGQDKSVQRGLAAPTDAEGSKSSDGLSWGLMQVTLKTGQALESGITVADLNNPDTSVRLAGKLLNQLIGRFGMDDRESVVRAYNGGPNYGAATLPYYAKFLTHLELVMATQPGDELETG